ncbi:alpha/beta fold hydrolase [Brevibacillus fluminis]|uniref:Alpha/beta fold hydrolase n=1 Tax=Brevibacillus fluminis TaxID=511487 RepID=A0A3M8DGI9_9BACL|nr:alpha/beta fold hydrolase [Brevibacillus fluminis]RNB87116.1 alpha/beta fold hydrolase [Brevibacillus fluminis]
MSQSFPVLAGAEPFFSKGNHIGVLVQHGFTGTPQSIRYLAEHLAACGFTVLAPLLKGHGTHYEDLERTTYEDWIASAEEGYQLLAAQCDHVFVAGLSMGGTIALHLAHRFPETGGLMLINAAVKVENFETLASVTTDSYLTGIGSDIKDPDAQELVYPQVPIAAVKQFLTFKEQVRKKLPFINCPALVFVSADDHVVPPTDSDYILEHLHSTEKRKVVLSNSYHVATLDHDKQAIAEQCAAFIGRIVQGHSQA